MLYRHYVTLRGDVSTVKYLNNRDGFPTEGPYETSEGDDSEGHYSTSHWKSEELVSDEEIVDLTRSNKVIDWDFNSEEHLQDDLGMLAG